MQEVMAAITTAPWSISKLGPSSRVTEAGLRGRSEAGLERCGCGRSSSVRPWVGVGASLAGNDSAEDSSVDPFGAESPSSTKSARAERKDSRASVTATRSCGRLGPAREGTTVARSSSSFSE